MTTQVVSTAYGGPEVLSLVSTDVPVPGPGQVTVQVRAIGMNPLDFKLCSGLFGNDVSKLAMPIGSEAAGVVTAVGYADTVTVDAATITPKPKSLSFETASGLMLTGVTAVHALTAAGIIGGTTVLIHGVAGGVG